MRRGSPSSPSAAASLRKPSVGGSPAPPSDSSSAADSMSSSRTSPPATSAGSAPLSSCSGRWMTSATRTINFRQRYQPPKVLRHPSLALHLPMQPLTRNSKEVVLALPPAWPMVLPPACGGGAGRPRQRHAKRSFGSPLSWRQRRCQQWQRRSTASVVAGQWLKLRHPRSFSTMTATTMRSTPSQAQPLPLHHRRWAVASPAAEAAPLGAVLAEPLVVRHRLRCGTVPPARQQLQTQRRILQVGSMLWQRQPGRW
mmetsp:Transcript_44841/g.112745  ORF Transcript_44841/g.112745 Transcript_44841/m.112745 type:complete len:255 (-) Transcript_44841:671-1435(-)